MRDYAWIGLQSLVESGCSKTIPLRSWPSRVTFLCYFTPLRSEFLFGSDTPVRQCFSCDSETPVWHSCSWGSDTPVRRRWLCLCARVGRTARLSRAYKSPEM